MISRLLAFVFAVPATLFGVAFAVMALEETSKDTREISACVYDVNRETQIRGNRRIPLKPTYLVIETDRNPQKFVHYLGALWGKDSLADRVRPGDCVRITVDRAALEGNADEGAALNGHVNGQALRLFLAKRALRSFVLGWPLLPSYNRPWVRIQRLMRGQEEVISPRDALFWPLVSLGGLSLLCFGIAAHQLHRVVFGAPFH